MINIGILGAGYFGGFHARAVKASKGGRLAAVCAETDALAEAFAAEHGGKPYGDWRRLLDDKSIDAIGITAPHHLHAPFASAALAAGKHVLLEKPMALTVAECDAIIAASKKRGAKLMIGQIMHFSLPCLVAREIVDRGDIGRPITGSSWLLKTWMEVNRRGWHLDPATGGGMLMTAGIHALDRLVWLMDGPVASVSAAVSTSFHNQKADDSSMLLLRFADGRFGQVASVGYRNGAGSFAMDLIGETGTLRIDFERGVSIGRDDHWTHVPNSWEEGWMQRGIDREWQAMIDCIAADREPPVTGAWGRHIIACIEAAMISSRERRDVAVSG